MDLKKLIQRSVQRLKASNLPNPLYGQKFFFYPKCLGPQEHRNQLIGYLGGFSEFNKLSNEVDVCVIPASSIEELKKEARDPVLNDLIRKLQSREEDKRPEVSPVSKIFLPEKELFNYIQQNLLLKDSVRNKQFERINFS